MMSIELNHMHIAQRNISKQISDAGKYLNLCIW